MIGPVFSREASTNPRRPRHFVARATYAAALVLLIATAWMLLAGTQVIRNVGDLARFSGILFQILAPLQLALVLFFSALFAASAVAQEKDRQTLLLLLMTDLRNSELVLGKLLSALLVVLVLMFSALPVFMGLVLMGGVEVIQVVRLYGVTLVTAMAAGSLGSTMALWREKTFQALALTALTLFVYLGACEGIAQLGSTRQWAGMPADTWSTVLSPWRAALKATEPMIRPAGASAQPADPVLWFLLYGALLTVAINAVAIARVRVWNPTRELRAKSAEADSELAAESVAKSAAAAREVSSRTVWDNPVAWREMRTWAYGRKIVAIRLAYVVVAIVTAVALLYEPHVSSAASRLMLVALFLISLVLINAQGVTSLSTERDGRTLDLLLVTDLTPREFIFGKLGGVLYNAKEMVLLPLLICLGLWWRGALTLENTFYIVAGLLVMDVFVAVLGLHCGLIHENSRVAVGTSLGTVFFLFVGVALCMWIMVAFGGAFQQSFQYQLPAFGALIIGGGVGLYVSLGARNASTAIFWAAFTCPFLTFWAITSYLLDYTLAVFLVMVAGYGFMTATMLIPALSEFDVASGRSSGSE